MESGSFNKPPESAVSGQKEEVPTEEIKGGQRDASDTSATANNPTGETRQSEGKAVSAMRPIETGTHYKGGYVVGPGDVLFLAHGLCQG